MICTQKMILIKSTIQWRAEDNDETPSDDEEHIVHV